MVKPRMMFYQDGRHLLIYIYEPPMQKEAQKWRLNSIRR